MPSISRNFETLPDNKRVMPTFTIATFGCKVNQYESQLLRERLVRSGWEENSAIPDLVVINTCAVTARAEAKVRKAIRRFLRIFPRSRMFVTGCGLAFSRARNRSLRNLVPESRREDLPWSRPEDEDGGITFFAGHSRAFVKIQDGCDSFCSYCVIPYLRGKPRSRPPEKIRREVASLISNGYREIVLTGIRLGRYGFDLRPPGTLTGLLKSLIAGDGSFRIRLSSIGPREITSPLINLIGNEEKLCPYLHIPLQSGSDDVLRRMNRPYSLSDFRSVVKALRETSSELSVSSDIMVGFPGETEEDFQRSCRAAEDLKFSKVHIFPYSRREGTEAAKLPVLPREIIKKRSAFLKRLSRRVAEDYRRQLIGREVEVLGEERRVGGDLTGWDEHYIRVEFPAGKLPPGWLGRVKITGLSSDGCRGEVISTLPA